MGREDDRAEAPELFLVRSEGRYRQMEAATLTKIYGEAVFYVLLSSDLCTSIPTKSGRVDRIGKRGQEPRMKNERMKNEK